jgi:hypothetical protein
MFATPAVRFQVSPHRLTDAGVYDNLGFEKALLMEARGELSADLILVSNAGAPFDWSINSSFFWPISRYIRAVDILMNRVSDTTLEHIAHPYGNRVVIHSSIQHNTKGGLPPEIQSRLKYIRTDLDTFNELEVESLISHGEQVTLENLSRVYSDTVGKETRRERPIGQNEREKRIRLLDRSALRKWGLFRANDWTSYVLVSLLVAILLCAYYTIILNPSFKLARTTEALDSKATAGIALLNQVMELNKERAVLEQQLDDARSTITNLKSDHAAQPLKVCRDPSLGIESFGKTLTISQESGWLGGGHSQTQWCDNLIGKLRSNYPDGTFTVLGTSETSRSACKPFNCPQYNYTCTVKVQAEPIYVEKASPVCR